MTIARAPDHRRLLVRQAQPIRIVAGPPFSPRLLARETMAQPLRRRVRLVPRHATPKLPAMPPQPRCLLPPRSKHALPDAEYLERQHLATAVPSL